MSSEPFNFVTVLQRLHEAAASFGKKAVLKRQIRRSIPQVGERSNYERACILLNKILVSSPQLKASSNVVWVFSALNKYIVITRL